MARPRSEINLPNGLTALRLAAVPIFGALWLADRRGIALVVLLCAAATDFLDGLLARTLDQRTEVGSLLDPAADKLTLLVAYLAGGSAGAVPWWLVALVLGRDLLLTSGAALYTLITGTRRHAPWRPTRLGKYSTFYQLATIGLALLAAAMDAEALRPWVAALGLVAAQLTIVSAAQYLVLGARALRPA